MNAPSLNELRTGLQARELADEKMMQVRDLLIGDYMRANEARMAAMEGRLRELETGLGQRLTLLQQRIEALAIDTGTDRRAAFDELAACVVDLSERIRHISRS
jgi:hypothetical protein